MILIKKLKIGIIGLLFMISVPVVAQKYGHINTQELLNLMPEKAAAEQKLKNKAEEYDKTLKDLQTEYQTLASNYLKGVEDGSLIDPQKSSQEKQIQDLETRIRAFDQNASKELQTLRNDLFLPIITKVRRAINEVAEEDGYTYVFDASAGSLVYISTSSNDLMPRVKVKLGL